MKAKARTAHYGTDVPVVPSRVPDEFVSTDREAMILRHAPLIKFIAHRLAMRLPSHISVEDLISAGVIGLIDAISKFDPKKNVQFKTYAEFRIRGAMLDELRSLDWVPRSVRQKATQLEKVYLTLEKKKGRPAEDDEVAKELDLPMENFYDLLNEVNSIPLLDIEALRQKMPQLTNEDLLNLIVDESEKDPFDQLRFNEIKDVLARAIGDLSPKEKTVVSLYYYEELTLKEIGEIMGFTESRICQIHTKAILKLRGKIKRYLEETI